MYFLKPVANQAVLPADNVQTRGLNGGFDIYMPEKKSGGLTGIVKNNINKAIDYIASIKRQHSKGYKEELIKDYLVNKTRVLDSLEIPRKMQESFVYENTKVNKDGSLDTTVLDNRIKTLQFNQAYSEFYRNRGSDDVAKTDYNPVKTVQGLDGVADLVIQNYQNNNKKPSMLKNFFKKALAIGTMTGVVYAATTLNPGAPKAVLISDYACNSVVCASWEIDTSAGWYNYVFGNLNFETVYRIDGYTAHASNNTTEPGWVHNYNDPSPFWWKLIGQSDVLDINEQTSLSGNIDPDLIRVTTTGYFLFHGSGNTSRLDDVAWVEVVPEPVSSILFVTGGSLLAGRQFFRNRRRRNKNIVQDNKLIEYDNKVE